MIARLAASTGTVFTTTTGRRINRPQLREDAAPRVEPYRQKFFYAAPPDFHDTINSACDKIEVVRQAALELYENSLRPTSGSLAIFSISDLASACGAVTIPRSKRPTEFIFRENLLVHWYFLGPCFVLTRASGVNRSRWRTLAP
jgi:hypothetical protein